MRKSRLFIGGIVVAFLFLFISCQTVPTYKHLTVLEKPACLNLYLVGDEIRAEYLMYDVSASHNDLHAIYMWMLTNPEYGKKLTIEIASPGGEAMAALRAVSIMDLMQQDGFFITTQCNCMAASAGFLIFQAGTHRRVSDACMLMWHHAQIPWPWGLTPEAQEYLKALDDNMAKRIAERTGISASIILAHIDSGTGNWWITGRMAVEMGLADEMY